MSRTSNLPQSKATPAADPPQAAAAGGYRKGAETRLRILTAALQAFGSAGAAGATTRKIAHEAGVSLPALKYYFGGKEGLYLAVLERAYAGIRALEQRLDVEHLPPVEALRQLAELTFDHHESHQDFVRLVTIENIHYAEHLERSRVRDSLAAPALDVLTRLMARGRDAGLFRDDLDALDVHMIISAYCVFRGANRYTFRAIFDRDLLDPDRRAHLRRLVGDLVVELVTARP